ncbi:MAG: AMP-binding protein [Candidatus Sulfobium sp.]|jgi:long-chain acyl-CoA synthetase
MDADQKISITDKFLDAARSYPENVLFHYFDEGWKSLFYSEFSRRVRCLASFLAANGIGAGDRAAIISENRPEWCSAYLSIIMAGGTAVPIDSQLGPEEIANLLGDSESKTVFHSRKTGPNLLAAREIISSASGVSPLLVDFDSPGYEMLLQTAPAVPFAKRGGEDTASIIYTSGTTGRPKGVMLTHGNFCADAQSLIEAGIVSHEDNVLAVLPLHHTYAFMCTFLVPLFLGASITYPESLKGPDLTTALQDRKVSVLVGVPQLLDVIRTGMLQKMEGMPGPLPVFLAAVRRVSGFLREKFDINPGRIFFRSVHAALGKNFRFFASGGARLDPSVMKDLEGLGFTVLEGYGLTETSPVVTFNPFSKRKPGSAGRPLPSVEIRILSPSGTGEGEIAVKGPMVMKGYYRNPSATAETLQEGWFRTGDIGRLDSEGYLFITGRSKEVIVLGSGKNIYPEEVEKAYLASPVIKEICVLGTKEGNALHAVVVPDLDYAREKRISNIQEEIKWEIREISSRLPSYMRITGLSVRTEPLPRTPLGKLRRFMITETAPVQARADRIKKGGKVPEDEISRKVLDSLEQFLGKGEEPGEDDNLELDLGLDSLSKIELAASLEKALSTKLEEDFLFDVNTVRELTEKIRKQAAAISAAGPPVPSGWKEILSREPSKEDLSLVSLEEPGKKMLPAFIIHSVLRTLFRIFFRLEAEGLENIPADGNFIVTPNHTSYLDGFVAVLSLPFSYFRRMYALGLSEFFAGRIKGWFAKTAHVIPIDSSAYLSKALQVSAHVLAKGRSLIVFPEGGRSFDGTLMEFKKGVGILAVEAGIPVVPAYIQGTFRSLPRGAAFPRPEKIRIIFGQPLRASSIDFTHKKEDTDDYQHFADLLKKRVEELKDAEKAGLGSKT